jgi:concanavalin A-like lectin/glucanase superfamily protein
MKTLLAFLLFVSQLQAGYLKQIVLSVNSPGNLVPSAQTNFIVPIMIGTFSYLKTVGNGGFIQNTTTLNGNTVPADLVFSTTACTSPTLIKWEITQGYNATTGLIQIWARIASLGTGVTTVYGCFDNTAVTTYQGDTSANVWSGAVAVYHLEDGGPTPDTFSDALNQNQLTGSGSSQFNDTAGQLARGVQPIGFHIAFISSGTTPAGPNGITGGTHAISMSCWANIPSGGTSTVEGTLIGVGDKSTGGATFGLDFYHDTIGTSDYLTTATSIPWTPNGNWHLIHTVNPAGNSAYSSIVIYLDGSTASQSNVGSTALNVLTGDMTLAATPTAHNTQFGIINGLLDECHVWNVSLTQDWITTEYNSQSAPGTFTTITGPTDVSSGLIPRRVVIIQ